MNGADHCSVVALASHGGSSQQWRYLVGELGSTI